MRAHRRRGWLALAAAGLVLLAGCAGNGEDEAGVTRTTTVEATSTVPVPVPATEPALVTTTTAPEVTVAPPRPVLVDGTPQVTVTPTRGVAGTRVEVDGYGFEGRWQAGGPLWLSNPDQEGCGLLAELDADLELGADGHLTGSFVVPAEGVCRDRPDFVVQIGGFTLDLLYRCNTDCKIGSFTIILPGESTEEPTGTMCEGAVVYGFGEDAASGIYADGLSCEEGMAFLQAHAEPSGAFTGAAHIEADGFTCDRTGQTDRYIPRANYKCTRGNQAIFFVRT